MTRHSVFLGSLLLFLTFPASAQNLIGNGDFENGTTGWTGGFLDDRSPHGGRYCLRVEDNDPRASIDAHTSSLIPIEQGKTFLLQVWVRAASENQPLLVTLNQFDEGGSWIYGENMDFYTTAGTGWSLFERTLRSFHPQARQVQLYLRPAPWSEGGEATGTAWFDDISLAVVPDEKSVYGQWLRRTGPVRLWLSPAEQKIRPEAFLPDTASDTEQIALELSGGEEEAVQLVLWPQGENTLTDLSISVLTCSEGDPIAPDRWNILEAVYLLVTQPSDQASWTGWMPDPLPGLQLPLALRANQQTSLWLSLRLPERTRPASCRGRLTLTFADDSVFELPVSVRVFGFTLPREHHLQTAYGLWLDLIDRYHHLQGDPELRRQVFRAYLRVLAAHRLSVYDPLGDDQIVISFPNLNWPLTWVVSDPDNGANHLMRVVDERTDANVAASAESLVPVASGSRYFLAWRARTDSARAYLVAATQHRADGSWISGRNLDFVRQGNGAWATEQVIIEPGQLAPEAAFLRLYLYACPWTEQGELTGTTWYDDVRLWREGEGQNLVPNGDFETDAAGARAEADFCRADPALAYALDTLGMDSFRLHLPYFAGGDWTGSYLPELFGFPWGSPEYQAIYRTLIQAMTEYLDARGWLEKAYTYWFDEPEPSAYALVREGMELIHQAEPRLRRLLTEQFEPELAGAVDIWAPLLDYFSVDWAGPRQALGEEVWWYVCTWPPAPYPGNFIDHNAIEHRLRYWMAWQYGLQGDLYWAVNWWTADGAFPPENPQDPWSDPMSYNFYNNQVGTWGNGDGRLLYPPRHFADGRTRVEGPTVSLRLELIRDGIEDFEYLWLLRDTARRVEERGLAPERVAAARALLDIPPELFTSTSQFCEDPARLHDHRRAVALMIEELSALLESGGPDGGTETDAADGGDGWADAAASDATDAGADDQAEAHEHEEPMSDASFDGSADSGPSGREVSGGCGCSSGGSPTGLVFLCGIFLAGRHRRRAPRRLF